jgi:hypothetical protein
MPTVACGERQGQYDRQRNKQREQVFAALPVIHDDVLPFGSVLSLKM